MTSWNLSALCSPLIKWSEWPFGNTFEIWRQTSDRNSVVISARVCSCSSLLPLSGLDSLWCWRSRKMVPIRGGTKGKRHVHIKLLRRTVHMIKKMEYILLIKESQIFINLTLQERYEIFVVVETMIYFFLNHSIPGKLVALTIPWSSNAAQ